MSGHLTLLPANELLAVVEHAATSTHEQAFREQQQKIQRLNAYCDNVVAQLSPLLDQSDEGSWFRPSAASATSMPTQSIPRPNLRG
jgi:hypothetical protein